MSDDVDFLHAGKHESLLQIDTMILMGWEWSSIPKVPKIASLQCLYNISKKELEVKLIFCMYINIKVFCKVILSLLLGVTKQAFSNYSKQKVCSIFIFIYLQIYLHIFLEVRNRVHFCMLIIFKVSTSWDFFFEGCGRRM